MKPILLILLFIAVNMTAIGQNTSIVQIEYFFDTDQGIGKNTLLTVTPVIDGVLPFVADISRLSVGRHKLCIRTRDSDGKWSLTTRNNVDVFALESKENIQGGEYFIDTDPGVGSGKPLIIVAPDSVVLEDFTISTANVTGGYHKLYGRFKDDHDIWSLTFRRNIKVYKNDTNYVNKAEYFFKTDNGYGNCTEIDLSNPSVDGTFSFTIPLNQIPANADTLFLRTQDSTKNRWSLTGFKGVLVPLALTLIDFTAARLNNIAQLKWETENEINTAYFNIQRSTAGTKFTNRGKVEAQGLLLQNDYAYNDDISQLNTDKALYRLQEVDKDGQFIYSEVKELLIPKKIGLFTISPNPAADFINVVASKNVGNAQLSLTDINGRVLYSATENFETDQPIRIPTTQLAKQMLILVISTVDGRQTFKVVKQ